MQTVFDFRVADHGTLFLLTPLTSSADEWVEEHIQEGYHAFGNAIVVEHRYIEDIVEGIRSDGFNVEVES